MAKDLCRRHLRRRKGIEVKNGDRRGGSRRRPGAHAREDAARARVREHMPCPRAPAHRAPALRREGLASLARADLNSEKFEFSNLVSRRKVKGAPAAIIPAHAASSCACVRVLSAVVSCHLCNPRHSPYHPFLQWQAAEHLLPRVHVRILCASRAAGLPGLAHPPGRDLGDTSRGCSASYRRGRGDGPIREDGSMREGHSQRALRPCATSM